MSNGKVIAGDYKGYDVIAYDDKCFFMLRLKRLSVDKSVVSKYEIIDDISHSLYWKKIAKGAVSGVLFGAVGLLVASSTDCTKPDYLISIEFKDGKRSLIQVGSEEYKSILCALYS